MSQDLYRNIKLKKHHDFALGSLSANFRESHGNMELAFTQLAQNFNGVRSDLLATNDLIHKTQDAMNNMTRTMMEILGCEVSHVIVDLGEEVSDVEDEQKYLKLIRKIDRIEDPFKRLEKYADVDALLGEAIDNRSGKLDSMHERLKLSNGVQTPENMTVHGMIEKLDFVVGGLKTRREKLTAIRDRLYKNMKIKLEKHKPEIHFNQEN